MNPVTSYQSMLPVFLMDLPGLNDVLAKQALALAGRKFCMDTELYTKELEPIDIVAETREYSLSSLLPSNTAIIRLAEVRYGETATDDTTTAYNVDNYSLEDETIFKFVTAPSEDITDGLVCNVILRPIVSSTSLESWFFDRYFEAIAAYAKYYLLSMDKKKPWSDSGRATSFKNKYRDYLDRYKREKFTEYKNKPVRVDLNGSWNF